MRKCGSCTECCEKLGVTEIDKPEFTPCPHQLDHKCGIYATRPKSCRTYNCLWLQGVGPSSLRPDKSRVVLTGTTAVWKTAEGESIEVPIIQISELADNSTLRGRVKPWMEKLATHAVLIVVNEGKRKILGGPMQYIKHAPSTLRHARNALAQVEAAKAALSAQGAE